MKPQIRRSAIALSITWGLASLMTLAHADTLKKPALDAIAAQSAQAPTSFAQFLQNAAKQDASLANAVKNYADGKALQGDDLTNIARLLGLYTRLTQEGKILASMEKMVALPTVRDPKIPPHENKAIIEFGKLVEQMANQALAVADRAYVLETGRFTLEGAAADLRRDPKVRAAYLGAHA